VTRPYIIVYVTADMHPVFDLLVFLNAI